MDANIFDPVVLDEPAPCGVDHTHAESQIGVALAAEGMQVGIILCHGCMVRIAEDLDFAIKIATIMRDQLVESVIDHTIDQILEDS